jgi:uncharacterized membrane protein YciS (DUF1049 family)
LATFRKVLVFLMFLLFAAVAATLAYLNPGEISVNLAFVELESVAKPLAFAMTFAFGWLFGLVCLASVLLRFISQRRRLRRDLRAAESEVSGLRSLPLNDAN